MKDIYQVIKQNNQIKKFCLYGFLKNLRFFEPYLYIYLIQVVGLNLFQIGTLFSIREAITYIFEVPSGILADQYGKKTELVICFIFYIISFFFFYVGGHYSIILIAMLFYGLGEAFRSGTHKAMIYAYLEQKGWFKHKTFVYGRTRSFSLIGSSLSAFAAIFLVIKLPKMQTIFLFSIIPYILDFLLIWSYPNSLNEQVETKLSMKKFWVYSINQLKEIFSNKALGKVILSSSLFDGIFKILKDYIQPILKNLILISGIYMISSMNADTQLKIILGLIYGVMYIFSSMVSRNVYRLNLKYDSDKLMDISFDVLGVVFFIMFFAIKSKITLIVILLYFILYLLKDGRRPLAVDVFGNYMRKKERATVMSVESQTRSFFMIILAPLFGYIADRFGIAILFFIIGSSILILNRFLRVEKNKSF
ncbi:MAG: MFS transporter [Candidatus Caldatribacteriota bacterium]|nr:MFS transporter [Candidatus Caldatribacteriota bacterium]